MRGLGRAGDVYVAMSTSGRSPNIVASLAAARELGITTIAMTGSGGEHLRDDVVEGLRCLDIPAFSVQYHPEAAAGPHDAAYLFDRFVELLQRRRTAHADTTDQHGENA